MLTADFDPGIDTFNLTSAGQQDIFISKLDPAGNFIWARQFAGDSTESVIISDAATVGTYIVADAIRLVTYDTTGLSSIKTDFSFKPSSFELFQNYPNPFNPKTVISYRLSVIGKVDLDIYDTLGKKVATLISEKQSAGAHKVTWNAGNHASGLYIVRLKTDYGIAFKKMMLIR